MVHLRLEVEGKRDAAAAEEVAQEVELQEPVQERGGEGERREGVARPRHQRRRAEKQLARRLAGAGGDRSLHQFGLGDRHGKVVTD